jgi:low affinity Fe/Cu permease
MANLNNFMKEKFRTAANKISAWAGSASVFIGAVVIIIIWALSGDTFGYSDTWQLVINTGTTIVTFLMVFLIQNTQNRDAKAVQLKLDELIKSSKNARNSFVGLEDLTDEELKELDKEFKRLNQDPEVARTLAKLHKKIEAEKQSRFSLTSHANAVIGTIGNTLLKPLGNSNENSDNSSNKSSTNSSNNKSS